MATIELIRAEAEEGLLPPVCMECGQPAVHTEVKQLTW